MSFSNTVTYSNGSILTGKLWRKDHSFFHDLPFYSNIPKMDEIAGPLQKAFEEVGRGGCYVELLLKFGKGLDDVHPFSDTGAVDVVLREAKKLGSANWDEVSPKYAARIWGFISKFVMLDRFIKTLKAADFHPCIVFPKMKVSEDYIGTASKILEELNPPTKVLGKFLKTWGDRDKIRAEYSHSSSTISNLDAGGPAVVALGLSRRLMDLFKVKSILNIEAGIEMIALAMLISSENDGMFPESVGDVNKVLRRIWLDRMAPQQLEDHCNLIQTLHKSMKNVIEIVFATSPLLALSTHGWAQKSFHSTYLLRAFVALGNDRPEILIRLEDQVLLAIIGISEGKSREDAMGNLYSQILFLEKELAKDDKAMNWFNLLAPSIRSLPASSQFPSTPLLPIPELIKNKKKFQGGLASPPNSCNNSPLIAIGSSSASKFGKLPPPRFVKPSNLHDPTYFSVVEPERAQENNLMEQEFPKPSDQHALRSRTSSLLSSLSGSTENEDEVNPTNTVKAKKPSAEPSEDSEEVNQMVAIEAKTLLADSSKEADEVDRMIGESIVETKKPSEDGEEVDRMVCVGAKTPLVDSLKDDGVVDRMIEELIVENEKPSSDPSEVRKEVYRMIDEICVESKKPLKPSPDSLEEEVDRMCVEFGVESKNDQMIGVESTKPRSDSTDSSSEEDDDPMNGVDGEEGHPMTGFDLMKLSDSTEDPGDPAVGTKEANTTVGVELNKMTLDSSSSIDVAAELEPRRSSRNSASKNKPIPVVDKATKSSFGKKKQSLKKHAIPPKSESLAVPNIDDGIDLQSDSENETQKLSDVGKATYHPTLYAEIAGWGSTVDAGAKPYRHIPVQIVPPGDVLSTGDDTETLRKVEALIQADFKDGLPPHLQPNAKSMEYAPGSDQSRIFVVSHSEFSSLHARDVQRILRNRLILVHGNSFDYSYGWDLESFGRLHDVDKKITVQVSTHNHPLEPGLRHHQGTLREFHKITTSLSNEDCPPLNAISLKSHRRNLYIPCQFGSFASNEVAQSRLPPQYEERFGVPEVKSCMEWSLIGGKGAISPFHVDSEGFGTVVTVLEGSKYWIVATRLGDTDTLTSVDSLGPDWSPYLVNDGDKANRFRFEAVHLQKGDMLVMPGGVPHWVLGTSNAICAGRHFYATSAIRSSVIGIVHTYLLSGALTNEDYPRTRTLLYQLMVFWSMRLDVTDVDGPHIPVLSSEEEFLDVVYLGVFIILSPAFDPRFYSSESPSANLVGERTHAIHHFRMILLLFSRRFYILLNGECVLHKYVVDRMLAEFAAAAVVFAKALPGDGDDELREGVSFPSFSKKIEGILRVTYPELLPYFSRCLDRSHKQFVWTGPTIHIISHSLSGVIPLTTRGQLADLPSHSIYAVDLEPATPTKSHAGKRHGQEGDVDVPDERPKKRQR